MNRLNTPNVLEGPDSPCSSQDSLGDEFREMAVQLSGVAVRAPAGQVEADPADDFVFGVLPLAAERLEDREQQNGADPRVERVTDVRRLELGARIGAVFPEAQILVEAVQDPVGFLAWRPGCRCHRRD